MAAYLTSRSAVTARSCLLLVVATTLLSSAEAAPAANDPATIVPLSKATFFLFEDFESTEPGKIPKAFTPVGSVGVVDDVAHTGRHSLRLNAAVNGARQIVWKGPALTAMGGEHWGRLFYRVQLPSPLPAGGGIHTTIVVGAGMSPLAKDKFEVRLMGTSTRADGAFSYLYNVQPLQGRPEFGKGSGEVNHYSDSWTLAEWYVDYATQSYRFFVNGKELTDLAIHKGANTFAGAEIPQVFDSLAFGWQNYQAAAGTGFTTWIDDIALTRERIGGQKQIKQDEPLRFAPAFTPPATEPKVAKIEDAIAKGHVGHGIKDLEKLSTDKDAKVVEAATASLAAIQAWKEQNDAEYTRLKDAGDVFTAAELASGMATSYAGHDAAKDYQDQAATLKKDPAYPAGKEFQKLAEFPADQLKDPRFVKLLKAFVKKYPMGYYFDLAQALLPDK
ncbi:MAG: hypothetical protein H0X38_01370 [Planctomycetes bacterium]|nr:hypothetical protein [Planctomycetota bacterium]